MAEVIRVLTQEEKGNYMPFCELLNRGRDEVYEAAGAYLMMAYEVDGYITMPADFLIELSMGTKVSFFCGESINIDAIH